MTDELPCPVCGFETVEENYGSYMICEVCNWEDDSVQLANPCSKGGANGYSLAQAQMKLLKKYPLDVSEIDGLKRSKNWRPLSANEIDDANKQLELGPWPNKGILYEAETYWYKNS